MVSYIVEGVSTILGYEEDDNPKCLIDPSIIAVYENPHKQLQLSQNATPWEIRDKVRDNSIRLLGERWFNKIDKPLLPWKHTLIAYHLVAKTLKVTKAQDLKKLLDTTHYFKGQPTDFFQVLRPLHSPGITMHPAVRACGFLAVVYQGYELSHENDVVMPHQLYNLKVVYCAREHSIKRRYTEFVELNAALEDELMMVPGLPERDVLFKVGLGDVERRGAALCAYVNRVHSSLAARGVFSPRLVEFLEVDASRVHVEEDGRVSKVLDTQSAVNGSVWHMVDELWLKRWRKFVLGRAARRYEPPGPMTNERLLIPLEKTAAQLALHLDDEQKARIMDRASSVPVPVRREPRYEFDVKDRTAGFLYATQASATQKAAALAIIDGVEDHVDGEQKGPEPPTIGVHYRAVNYNLFMYWKMVHGGGPCISRKTKDILSVPACGPGLEARLRLQRFGRVVLAKGRKLDLYWNALSKSAPGVREVLAGHAERRLKDQTERAIKQARATRTTSRLSFACRYTQRTWRSKKKYAFNDDGVRTMKHAQEVFAAADGEVETGMAGQAFVVEEGERIVALGKLEHFEIKFSERDGPTLPISLAKHACSETSFVNEVRDEFEQRGLVRDSILLVIDDYPVSSLTHKETMKRLAAGKWPLKLRFERPILDQDLTPWAAVCALYREEGRDAAMKLQLMKRLLVKGIRIKKHGRRGSPHFTVLYLSESHIFWETRTARTQHKETPSLSLKYDLTRGFSLYDLKYVRIGKLTLPLRRSSASVDKCFSIFTANRTLDFEVVDVDGDPELANQGRNTLAWAFDAIIREVRGSQIFVDKTGAPTRRAKPQKRLRVLL